MKLTLERATLAAALTAVTPAAARPGSSHMHVLTGVRIAAADGNVTLTCSNLDLTISTTLAVLDDVNGVCIAPALLAKVIRASKAEQVTLEYDADDLRMTVKAGRATTSVRCYPVDEWPAVEEAQGDRKVIDSSLLGVLDEAARFASVDTARPVLCGVHFGDGHVEATDSFAAYRAPLDLGDVDAIVPAELVHLLVKAGCDVHAVIADRTASFTAGNCTYTTRLIEGQFPPVKTFVRDTSPIELTLDVDELVEAIREVTPLVGPAIPVRLKTADGRLVIEVIDQDVGSSSSEVDVDGSLDEMIAFNPKYLNIACVALSGKVTLGVQNALKPAVINDDRGCRILMPVRVS